MPIEVRIQNTPMDSVARQELTKALQKETGEEVEIADVAGLFYTEILEIILPAAVALPGAIKAFSDWRRDRAVRNAGEPPVKATILGPDGEVLHQVHESDP